MSNTPKRGWLCFSIRDVLQKHAKLTEKRTKVAEESKRLQIQADLDAIDRGIQSREFEQYKRKTLVESLQYARRFGSLLLKPHPFSIGVNRR